MRDAKGRARRRVGVVADITERKRAEEERREHLWFLECMDRVNRAMQRTNDVEGMMSGVLEETLAIFGSDRAWLVYPCDPDAATSRVVMEHTRPEYPGAFALGEELPVDRQAAELLRRVLDGPGAATDLSISPEIRERFSIQSVIAIAVRPKGDRPYLFGLHQCSHARAWTAAERRLFEEIARRLEDALTSGSPTERARERGGVAHERATFPDVRRPRDRRLLPVRRGEHRARRKPPGV